MIATATPLTRAELEQLRAERGLPPYNQALIYQPRPLAGPDWSAQQNARVQNRKKAAASRARWAPKAALRGRSRKAGAA